MKGLATADLWGETGWPHLHITSSSLKVTASPAFASSPSNLLQANNTQQHKAHPALPADTGKRAGTVRERSWRPAARSSASVLLLPFLPTLLLGTMLGFCGPCFGTCLSGLCVWVDSPCGYPPEPLPPGMGFVPALCPPTPKASLGTHPASSS